MDDRQVLLGRIVGVFGVDGWVKLHSFTEPRDNIFRYRPWTLRGPAGERSIERPQGRAQGKGVVARLDGVADRDAAAAWMQKGAQPTDKVRQLIKEASKAKAA